MKTPDAVSYVFETSRRSESQTIVAPPATSVSDERYAEKAATGAKNVLGEYIQIRKL